MRLTLLSALVLLTCLTYAQSREIRGAEANNIVEGAEFIWQKQDNTLPNFIQMRSGSELPEQQFLQYLQKKFVLPGSYSFQVTSDEVDALGWQHKRYVVYVNGLPVGNSDFVLHLQNGLVKKFNGYIFKNIQTPATPSVSEQTALNNALADIHATTYKWQLSEEEEFLKQESGNPNATFYPKGNLEIVQIGDNTSTTFRLAWKFDVYAHEPMSRYYVYVDAQTGTVIKKVSRICDANTNGTAVTAYRGARAIVADSYNGSYRLRETTRGLGVRTFNLQKGTNYGAAVDFTDADNYWNNVNTNKDQYAGDAHWGAEMTYDFYSSNGRNSIDNAGYQLNLYVHYSTNYLNAFWDGTRMTFGDGSTGYNPLTSLDITGHEISHGLDEHTANLTYSNESGALNESFSDIFGTAVEWYADSTLGNWLIGEDIGNAFRSMSNPNAYGDPDTYHGTNWYTGTADNGGVHTNSNVQNHWYYRLAQGGSGTNDIGNAFNVTGIGRHKATQIAWRNMVYYLTSGSTYTDARFYAIQSANDLFGTCSPEAISTTNAWYAVGVGAAFSFGVDAQFTGSPLTGCDVPFTVNFTNASTNANSFVWNFGDGGTSTATNPSHTYTTLGTYTVKLLSNGGACGVDSLVSANLVNISTSNPCVVIMPTTGTYQTQTSCNGTIYDNGGPSANYSDNTNSTLTISPTGASKVKLHFTQFSMENTYDFLYIYDGPSTASPVIGSYTGTTIPADITSTGASITIRQYTDQSVNASGFTIQWTCINPNSPPVANFKADVTTTCTGNVQFTDLTTGGASAWLWNFGDGGTSTLQNPTHTYNTNGTFTVSLTATNNYGNNTATKNNYITVNKPAGPTANNPSSCGPSAFTLTANTTDPITWYDSTGNALSTANPYTTPVLNTTTTYYAQTTDPQPVYNVGAASNSIGGGGYYNGVQSRALTFRVFKKCKLLSVYVYAQTSGYRTVQYRDSLGGVITEKTVYCPSGGHRITLNIDLIPGAAYELGLRDTMYLYRNSSGPAYPYTDPNGMVSIFGNNAGAGSETYYYFFYDWEVKEEDCISLKSPVTATVNPAVTVSTSGSNALCNGGASGSASVSVLTGTPNYTYHWGGNQTTSSISNLGAGTYNVTVTDSKGCSATGTKTITQPTAISPTYTVTNVLCHGASTGALNAAITGGTGAYTYNWGGGITTAGRTNLPAGNYTVTVTDANSCTATVTKTVTEPAAIVTTATSNNPSCSYNSNGTISVSSTGGSPGYTYNWSGGLGTGASKNGLSAGSYGITTTDQNNCSLTSTFSLSSPPAVNVTVTAASTSCGLSNGALIASAAGGTGALAYLWNNGNTTAFINNAAAGSYTITVTDASSCTTSATQTVSSSTALSLSSTFTGVACHGQSTGNAAVTINSGNYPYTYSWSNSSTDSALYNITAGTYTASVTDNNGCTGNLTLTVTEPAAINVVPSVSNAICTALNGAVSLQVSGGTANYSYLWSNNQTTPALNNVGVGSYSVTITDANSCTASAGATVNAGGSVAVSVTGVDLSCYQSANGSATAVVTLGTAPFNYIWSNNSTGSSIAGLSVGSYWVSVSDANGCSASASALINQPAALTITASSTPTACGSNTGTISLQLTGGTPAYTYNWNTGDNSPGLSNLAAGNYMVTAFDANNCLVSATATVANVNGVTYSTQTIDAGCNGAQNGSVAIVITGGTAPFTYSWNNGGTDSLLTNLAAGTYTATITDANNCLSVATVAISQAATLSVNTTVLLPLCNGAHTGSISLNVSGGTPAYSYQWSNGGSGSSNNNLGAGNYSVTVLDANNCSSTGSINITEPPALSINYSATDVTCFGDTSGSLIAGVSGGTPSYTYLWNNGATSSLISNLPAGTYNTTVTDNHNCTITSSATINQPSEIQFTASAADATAGSNNGTASVSNISGGLSPYNIEWSNGATANTITGLAAGSYSLTITDANGCQKTATVTVGENVGVNEATGNAISFTLIPNPANDLIVITTTAVENTVATLTDVLGQILIKQPFEGSVTIDVSSLAAGTYYFSLKSGEKTAFKQLVISH